MTAASDCQMGLVNWPPGWGLSFRTFSVKPCGTSGICSCHKVHKYIGVEMSTRQQTCKPAFSSAAGTVASSARETVQPIQIESLTRNFKTTTTRFRSRDRSPTEPRRHCRTGTVRHVCVKAPQQVTWLYQKKKGCQSRERT
jgi:hypothetical protein